MAWVNLSGAFGYGTILTSTQMQNLRDNIAAAFAKDGGAPVLANDYIVQSMLDDNVVGQAEMVDSAIGQAELKETTAEDSVLISAGGNGAVTLPGGDYGLAGIKMKGETADDIGFLNFLRANLSTSYQTFRAYFDNGGGTSRSAYVQQRYIQASGEIFWYMVMRDKATKEILRQFSAPDHPCMMQNISPENYPHPWQDDFDSNLHEIVVINPDNAELENIRHLRAMGNRTILEVIEQEYDIDDTVEPDWPSDPITVGLPFDWEDAWLSKEKVIPIKQVILQPIDTKTAALKLKI